MGKIYNTYPVVCAGPIPVSSVPSHPCVDLAVPSQSDPAPSSSSHTAVFLYRLSLPRNPVSTKMRLAAEVEDTASNKEHNIMRGGFQIRVYLSVDPGNLQIFEPRNT